MDPITDQALVEEVLKGRKESYALILDRYKTKVYGLLRSMGATSVDAQDLAQETFMPSEISESKPAVFDSVGDSFNITSVEYFEKHKSYGDKQTLINISNGVFTNTITDDQWEVIDENGKTYRAHISTQGGGQDVRFGKPSYFSSGHIIVDKLTHISTQLTLRRKIVGRLYKDVNWSFMLPKEGKVLESNIINRDHLRGY